MAAELGISWTDTWLTIVTATLIYFGVIALSRVFGQRQFATSSTYDLVFVFALGSIIGRVILVRTSLATALLGLLTMFLLHAGAGWLHHNSTLVHDLMQNPPILLVANGDVLENRMRQAHFSEYELQQALRLRGHASLDGVRAVILERNGELSIIKHDAPLSAEVLEEVVGRETLGAIEGHAER